jgi:hypothetical protein
MIPCDPGYYCVRKNNTMVRTICPEGYYCPSATAVPHLCEGNGTCPEGSSSPSAAIKNCDAGYF